MPLPLPPGPWAFSALHLCLVATLPACPQHCHWPAATCQSRCIQCECLLPAPRTCWLLLSAAVIFARGFGPRRALSSQTPNQARVLDTGWWFKEAYQVAITSQMLWGSGLNPLGL
ncbi:hypothetical protein COCMIDRAFT_23548 [Bipolaris oryzae ATCC 44560]|uniref:Uncharacterized protein n=1 Tax=Bipolaris oryzae ATCC 44560 TaxID=930090 RepID=W6ZYM8_COCMI|nr:uncharacterized protein COCMIDRAFT_23548 [Bipolaris oryzae ATCC 44560]EUC48781.1 hypothetical protein COCMIDRAFT_23548 [Bipolaris oryzae ATCC 44560]